jgi:hypothetical protein
MSDTAGLILLGLVLLSLAILYALLRADARPRPTKREKPAEQERSYAHNPPFLEFIHDDPDYHYRKMLDDDFYRIEGGVYDKPLQSKDAWEAQRQFEEMIRRGK